MRARCRSVRSARPARTSNGSSATSTLGRPRSHRHIGRPQSGSWDPKANTWLLERDPAPEARSARSMAPGVSGSRPLGRPGVPHLGAASLPLGAGSGAPGIPAWRPARPAPGRGLPAPVGHVGSGGVAVPDCRARRSTSDHGRTLKAAGTLVPSPVLAARSGTISMAWQGHCWKQTAHPVHSESSTR